MNIDQFRKRLLNFSECCECFHSPSIFVSIRKPLVTLVRHSEAFATFVKHLQGVCNVRRFQFLANVLPQLTMIQIQENNEPSVIFAPYIYQSQPRHQIFASFVRKWQGNGNVGKTFASFISTFVSFASPFVSIRKHS